MTQVQGFGVVAVFSEFLPKPVDVVNAVIDRYSHGDRSDRDGHHIKGYVHQAHDAEHNAHCEQIRDNADDGDRDGSEQDQQHDSYAQQHDAQGEDL